MLPRVIAPVSAVCIVYCPWASVWAIAMGGPPWVKVTETPSIGWPPEVILPVAVATGLSSACSVTSESSPARISMGLLMTTESPSSSLWVMVTT